MMTTRILALTAAALAVTFSSCRPIGGPPPPEQPIVKKLTAEEEAKKKEEEARKKAEEELKKEQEQAITDTDREIQPPIGDTTPPPPEPPRTRDYPFANKVPGKDGFVFSPYNNKVVDVREIPSGTLVQDPTYPAAEKKFFRVP